MKQRYTWKEWQEAALRGLELSDQIEPRYIKLYGYEPEGDHYDFPDFIEIDMPKTTDL